MIVRKRVKISLDAKELKPGSGRAHQILSKGRSVQSASIAKSYCSYAAEVLAAILRPETMSKQWKQFRRTPSFLSGTICPALANGSGLSPMATVVSVFSAPTGYGAMCIADAPWTILSFGNHWKTSGDPVPTRHQLDAAKAKRPGHPPPHAVSRTSSALRRPGRMSLR